MIKISEKDGLSVKPHNALLQGDMLESIMIKYQVPDVQDYTRKIDDRKILIDTRTTTTVWEFLD